MLLAFNWTSPQVVTQLKLQVDSQATSTQHLRGVAVAPHAMMASAVPVAPHVATWVAASSWQKRFDRYSP